MVQFLAKSGGQKYFFRILTVFKVKQRPQKTAKIDFSNFENSNQKTVEVRVKNV